MNYLNSIIIAGETYSGTHSSTIELFCNFFKKEADIYLEDNIFLDIGIKIKDVEKCRKIVFLFPFNLSKENVIDLFDIIKKDGFVNSLYNSSLKFKTCDENSCVFSFLSGKEEFFQRVGKYIKIENFEINSSSLAKVEINLCNLVNEIKNGELTSGFHGQLNFRIRIMKNGLKEIVKTPKNSSILSLFSPSEHTVTQILDFRFNYIRSFEEGIISYLRERNLHLFQFDKVRFSTIEPINCIIENYSDIFFKARVLEGDIWRAYVNDSLDYINNMISYVWEIEDEKIDKIQIMFRRTCRRFSILFFLVYILITLLLGFTASFLAP